MSDLHWLPRIDDWKVRLRALAKRDVEDPWREIVALANARLDFVSTNALDEIARRVLGGAPPADLGTRPVRLAFLGASTLAHLHAAIRVAGFRRGIWITTYEADYGQYFQELLDPASALHGFRPTTVLFALDAHHLTQGLDSSLTGPEADAALDEALERIGQCWRVARDSLGAAVIHQTALNPFPELMGANEHRLPGSRRRAISRLNAAVRDLADIEGVDLLALDSAAERHGLRAWHDPALWHRSKQEVSPAKAPLYGDLVGRLIAARLGRSQKALVLDLDNTLWGGVIGDDGLEGIVLGQGSGVGEGFVAVQAHAKELSRRGIILAVSSKNDEAVALEPFESHPDMVLRRGDIAAFRADWNDKAGNIRAIAQELNIGLDAMVFLDDNPFERNLVREQLPMVAVPEVPDDPALWPQVLADAGYFESLALTAEDRDRASQYQGNIAREKLRATTSDLAGYLRDLDMRLIWSPFDRVGLKRIVQLINKTNQFNLTTRRHDHQAVLAVIDADDAFGLQIRLTDRFGDNGIIAIVIGRARIPGEVVIDTWLMSCRVLGRQVEATTLNLVVDQARRLGARRLIGEYIPTKKNAMVKDHYVRLGFEIVETGPGGDSIAVLDLDGFQAAETPIQVEGAGQ